MAERTREQICTRHCGAWCKGDVCAQPHESRWKSRANQKFQQCASKVLLRFKEDFRQKREASNSYIRVWRERESKIQRHIYISERDPDRQQEKNVSKCTTVRPLVYRVDSGARRVCKAQSMQASQRALQDENTTRMDVDTTHFFRRYVTTEAKYTATGSAKHSKEKDVHSRQWRFVTFDGDHLL